MAAVHQPAEKGDARACGPSGRRRRAVLAEAFGVADVLLPGNVRRQTIVQSDGPFRHRGTPNARLTIATGPVSSNGTENRRKRCTTSFSEPLGRTRCV